MVNRDDMSSNGYALYHIVSKTILVGGRIEKNGIYKRGTRKQEVWKREKETGRSKEEMLHGRVIEKGEGDLDGNKMIRKVLKCLASRVSRRKNRFKQFQLFSTAKTNLSLFSCLTTSKC